MNGNGKTLIIENSIYTRSDSISISDEENLGKKIGIAIEGKRTITDYIWPLWVMEYKNDKEHNSIFVGDSQVRVEFMIKILSDFLCVICLYCVLIIDYTNYM